MSDLGAWLFLVLLVAAGILVIAIDEAGRRLPFNPAWAAVAVTVLGVIVSTVLG